MKKITLCNSTFGMILSMIALFWLVMVIVSLFADGQKMKKATAGFIMFAALPGVPGLWLCIRGRKRLKHETLTKQLTGYFKSHDSFTVAEMAKKIGKTEMETENLIVNLIEEQNLNLVFHRKTRQYLHKNRIHKHYQKIDRCPSCGASIKQEIIFEGEKSSCQYCDYQF